jgi:dolichol-phosphate mannosyltransferase
MESGELERRPTVAIVTPVFNEAETLAAYADEVRRVLLDRQDIDFRVVFVDDGSRDTSWSIIRNLCTADSRFRGIRLSRNFGSHRALSAGFAEGDADAVVTLAADLQDPPETILEFVEEWQKGAKIVWGTRASRKDRPWRVAASRTLNWLLKRFAMPEGSKFTTGSFFLIDRKVLEGVRQLGESNRIMFALVAWTGFEQATVAYNRRQRIGGKSGWTFSKMIKTMYDAFVGFSSLPIRVMTVASMSSFILAAALIVYFLVVRLTGTRVPGWASQMLLMSAFFGIQFWLMSIIGQYLSRIYAEVVRRPLYLVSETTDSPE